jgi:hypothetical protein
MANPVNFTFSVFCHQPDDRKCFPKSDSLDDFVKNFNKILQKLGQTNGRAVADPLILDEFGVYAASGSPLVSTLADHVNLPPIGQRYARLLFVGRASGPIFMGLVPSAPTRQADMDKFNEFLHEIFDAKIDGQPSYHDRMRELDPANPNERVWKAIWTVTIQDGPMMAGEGGG